MTVRISLGCVRRWDVAIKGGGGSISGYWCSVSAVSSVAGVWCLVSTGWSCLSTVCLVFVVVPPKADKKVSTYYH
jgi:hypothetical protein